MLYDTAVFYDIENIGGASLKDIQDTLKRTTQVGHIAVQRAYAHWAHQPERNKLEVFELGIDPIEVGSYEKNAADVKLAADAIELVSYLTSIHVYVLVSGDGGFVPLAKKLHEYNKVVVACGRETSTGSTLKLVCDVFVPICSPGKHESEILLERPSAALVVEKSESVAAAPSSGDSGSKRRILDALLTNPEYVKKMRNGGLPIGSLAEPLRRLKDPRAGKNRWLIKLLLSACKDGTVSVARSRAHGEYRLFEGGHYPEEFVGMNEPASHREIPTLQND